jgi:hypothetical protein
MENMVLNQFLTSLPKLILEDLSLSQAHRYSRLQVQVSLILEVSYSNNTELHWSNLVCTIGLTAISEFNLISHALRHPFFLAKN